MIKEWPFLNSGIREWHWNWLIPFVFAEEVEGMTWAEHSDNSQHHLPEVVPPSQPYSPRSKKSPKNPRDRAECSSCPWQLGRDSGVCCGCWGAAWAQVRIPWDLLPGKVSKGQRVMPYSLCPGHGPRVSSHNQHSSWLSGLAWLVQSVLHQIKFSSTSLFLNRESYTFNFM